MLINLLTALIPIIIIVFFILISDRRKIKNINLNNILNIILCGFLSTILTGIFVTIFKIPKLLTYGIAKKMMPMLSKTFLVTCLDAFFVSGMPEELAKWISIKKSKPQKPYKILINSLFIGAIFMALENYSYMSMYAGELIDGSPLILLSLYRVFMPIHIACQVTMALLMIKAYEKKKEGKKKYGVLLQILSIAMPILLHASYNTYTEFNNWEIHIGEINVMPMTIILGICAYIFTFISIVKITKNSPDNETNENNESTKLNIKKLVLVIIITVLWIMIFGVGTIGGNTVNMNETLIVQESNIEITANSIEEINITDSGIYNGTYVKIHLDVKNNANETVELSSLFSFNLLKNDESINVAIYGADDIINLDIPSGETSSGYLYFETELIDGLKLEYIDKNFDVENLKDESDYYYIELN